MSFDPVIQLTVTPRRERGNPAAPLAARRSHRWHRAALPAAAAVAILLCTSLFATRVFADITYAYDTAGRLVAISDGAGKVITYRYDNDGNIIQVEVNSGEVAISEVSPTSGRVGTAVTIYGIGFSATPSQDTVTFNGTAATVTSATTSTISTTVPTGATTGAISVTSPSGSATGPTFTVITH
jgi:YD repeat-containing protein